MTYAVAWPGGVDAPPLPADTDVLGTGASMGGGITLAAVINALGNIIVAVQNWLESTPVYSAAVTASTFTVQDPVAYPMQAFTMEIGSSTPTFPSASAGKGLMMQVIQDATGGRVIPSWPGVRWAGGTPPTLSAGGGAIDIFSFVSFATHWYGFPAGQAMS